MVLVTTFILLVAVATLNTILRLNVLEPTMGEDIGFLVSMMLSICGGGAIGLWATFVWEDLKVRWDL